MYDNNNLSKSPLGLFGCGYTKYEPPAISLYFPFDVENPSTPLFGSRLDDYFNRSGVKIEQSCNGLLLCSAFDNNGGSEYYVFNPTTKQLAFIPPVPGGHTRYMAMALAFHHTHCVHYKVVCIFDLYFIQVQVYSSDTRIWKMCFESFSLPDTIFYHPVYWNGAVYWSPFSKYKLLQFKLDAEALQMLPLPVEMMTDKSSFMYFGESRGHLHLIYCTEGEEYILHVYEMLMDHSGWFVKYRLQFDRLLRDCPFLFLHYEHDKGFNEFYSRNDGTFHPSWCHSYIETLSAF